MNSMYKTTSNFNGKETALLDNKRRELMLISWKVSEEVTAFTTYLRNILKTT